MALGTPRPAGCRPVPPRGGLPARCTAAPGSVSGSVVKRAASARCAVVLACLLGGAGTQAQQISAPPLTLKLDPVVVTATRAPQLRSATAGAVSVVDKGDIQDGRQTVGLDESLNRIPGLLVQNSGNFAQDIRIQIRGFGTRAAFGTREIRVLVDGLPETLPDGQTDFDSVDLGAVRRIEVLRGPASSLYGNASGGVIQLFTEDGPDTPYAETRLTGGSYGLQKYQLKGGGRSGKARLFMNGSYTQTGGYRAHSGSQSGLLTGKLRYSLRDDLDLLVALAGVDAPRAGDPGGLTRIEADRNPRQAAPLNLRQDAGEAVQQIRLGSVLDWRAPRGVLTAYAYGLYREFSNRLPVLPSVGDGVVGFYRFSPGGGVRYSVALPILGIDQLLQVGAEAQHQDDNRRRYANENGEKGELRLHQNEGVTGTGVYVRHAVYPLDGLELSGGVRYDRVHYDVDVAVPAGSDASGSRSMTQWSPAGGVRYSLLDEVTLYGTIGTAFQVPTTTELGNPSGPGFNPDVEPQTATSYELGARGEWGGWTYAEAALFRIDIRDELVRYQAASGRDAFRNAGRSRRIGAEIDWVMMLVRGVRWTSSFSWLDAEYRKYTTTAGAFDGNQEPGIPPWHLYQELLYRHRNGAYAAIEALVVERYFADDANSARSPSYGLVNLRGGIEHAIGRWTLSPFVGLNNLSDAAYDGLVRLNAQAGRYFEPAARFNVYGGLALRAEL
jgi:iron complex outermembrane receptor protein